MGYTPSPQGPAFIPFIPGPPPPDPARTTIQGAAHYPTSGYQLTLRNDSAATIRIDGFSTVFYDAHGTEVGSDQETLNEVLLSTGQSFTWLEYSQVNTEGSGSGLGTATIPAISTTCQLATLSIARRPAEQDTAPQTQSTRPPPRSARPATRFPTTYV